MSTFWPALQQMAPRLCPIALLQHEQFVRCLHVPYHSLGKGSLVECKLGGAKPDLLTYACTLANKNLTHASIDSSS